MAYTEAARSLGEKSDIDSILLLAKNLRGTSTDQEIDQVTQKD